LERAAAATAQLEQTNEHGYEQNSVGDKHDDNGKFVAFRVKDHAGDLVRNPRRPNLRATKPKSSKNKSDLTHPRDTWYQVMFIRVSCRL
jgi:hypothetical protein